MIQDDSLKVVFGKQTATVGDPITIKMPKMLPCLRCGSNIVEIKEWYCGDNAEPYYRCQCALEHEWDEWHDTKDKAIAAWNERPIVIMVSAETMPL